MPFGVSPLADAQGRPPRRRDGTRPSSPTQPRGGLVLRDAPRPSLPVCRPADWLRALRLALEQPAIVRLMRRRRRGRGMVIAVAEVFAAYADYRTGRNVAVSFATIAEQLHCEVSTVKKAVQFLSFLGFHVEAVHGRNILSLDELAQARAEGAETQTAIASTRHLVIPSWARALLRADAAHRVQETALGVDTDRASGVGERVVSTSPVSSAPLPSLPLVNDQGPVKRTHQGRASARSAGASRRRAYERVFDFGEEEPGWAEGVQEFAAELTRRLPWLLWTGRERSDRVVTRLPDGSIHGHWVGGRHIGQVCRVVVRERLIERGWTIDTLIELLGKTSSQLRVNVDPAEQRDPLAWFVWLVRQSIGTDRLSPALEARLAHDAARAERVQRRAEEAAKRARIAAEADGIAAVIEGMHQAFPTTRRPSRRPL